MKNEKNLIAGDVSSPAPTNENGASSAESGTWKLAPRSPRATDDRRLAERQPLPQRWNRARKWHAANDLGKPNLAQLKEMLEQEFVLRAG